MAAIASIIIYPIFRTPNCHRGKLRREKTKVSIKINIESEKRHLKNSKSLKMSSSNSHFEINRALTPILAGKI
jgi:hypothetical protein